MGNVVGFLRYGVGFIPALFLFLCVIRWGISWLVSNIDTSAPEYNFLRTFVALCLGASAMGMIWPGNVYGGMFGAIVSADIGSLIGKWQILVGCLALGGFLWMAGVLLNIKLSHIIGAWNVIYRGVQGGKIKY